MMNIKDFLIDNYIWILVIILITIVTIIGFIADKKKNGSKKEKNTMQPTGPINQNMSNQPVNNQGPMQYQNPNSMMTPQMNNNQMNTVMNNNINPMNNTNDINNNFNNNFSNNMPNSMNNNLNNNLNNNMGMNFNNMNQPNIKNTGMETQNNNNNQFNNNIQSMGTIPQPINQMQNNFESINNPQPVENITPKVETEPIYQPLSEQKPNFGPKPIPNFAPVENDHSTEINQIRPNMMPLNEEITPNVIPTPVSPINQQPINMVQTPMQPTMPSYNIPTQSEQIPNNNLSTNSNFMPNNNTIPGPTPVNPQPIMMQSMESNGYNQPQMMQPNNIQQPIQQQNLGMQSQQPMSSNQINPLPVNFVFGPQNNNQNM